MTDEPLPAWMNLPVAMLPQSGDFRRAESGMAAWSTGDLEGIHAVISEANQVKRGTMLITALLHLASHISGIDMDAGQLEMLRKDISILALMEEIDKEADDDSGT